jgi:hypothetical protein
MRISGISLKSSSLLHMNKKPGLIFWFIVLLFSACENESENTGPLQLTQVLYDNVILPLDGTIMEDLPIDRRITLNFSNAVDPNTIEPAISLSSNQQAVSFNFNMRDDNRTVVISPIGALDNGTIYTLNVDQNLKGNNGASFDPKEVQFKTVLGDLLIEIIEMGGKDITLVPTPLNVPRNLNIKMQFSSGIDPDILESSTELSGENAPSLNYTYSNNNYSVEIRSNAKLKPYKPYTFTISEDFSGINGEPFDGYSKKFYTAVDSTLKFPEIPDEELLTKVQEQTFKYFWDFAHPNCGLTRERNSSGNLVTIGGSGFGVMAILVGIERGFITRSEGVARLKKITDFLSIADRFHGVWPHWMNGNTGETIPFSSNDDGGDIVETAFMIQGLLTARQYLNSFEPAEKAIIDKINDLWEAVEWDWYTQGENSITWHWSPNFGFEKNLKIRGWNEALIVYVLVASSPTHSIEPEVYHQGWARNGNMQNGNAYYGITLPLGNAYGGPLFFEHYSFLGLDPRNLSDQYANYWDQAVAHSLINQAYCAANPKRYVGYSEYSWGLTASDNHEGYSAHSPTNDKGVITPTAALSSMPYTPEASMDAMRHFYYIIGDRLWGEYGFYDAFNFTENWVASSYLAIDQGPIVIMIENYRTGLLWDNFMTATEIKNGLDKLGFNY